MPNFMLLPDGTYWPNLSVASGTSSTYSNACGDFTATANAAAKTITFSAAVDTVWYAALTSKVFAAARILRRTSAGVVDTIPTTNVSFAANVLTLSDMSANFAAGDEVIVYLSGFEKAGRAQYNAAPTPRTEAQFGPLQADSLGSLNTTLATRIRGEDDTNDLLSVMQKPVVSTTHSWSWFQNLGQNSTLSVKASAGQVFSYAMHNLTGSNRFMMLFNTATVPITGVTAPTGGITIQVPPYATVILGAEFFGANGKYFPTGIAFACSSTENIFTQVTVTDHCTHVAYV